VIGNGGPGIRGPYATEPARLQALCLAMQGLGKPGCNQAKMIEWALNLKPEYRAAPAPELSVDIAKAYQGAGPPEFGRDSLVPKTLVPQLILNGQGEWYGNKLGMRSPREEQFTHYTYPADGCSKIHMIWTDSPSWITCWNDGNDFVRAVRDDSIEFMFAQHPWMEDDCLFADVILPVNTKLEEDDLGSDVFSGQMDMIYPEPRCMESLGESFSDYEIVCKIAERLGLLAEYTEGRSVADWVKLGYETSGVADRIGWEEFNRKGYYVVPPDPEWDKIPPGLLEFYEKPQENPLSTPTGKIEFYSTGLAEHFPDDEERPPAPKWIPEGVSHQETVGTERSRDYPLLVMSNHPRWGVHAQHDDVTWFREIPTCKVRGADGYQYQPLWMNPADAAARGIQNGDVVSIFNERGTVLAGAYVTQRIMPGAVGIDHGAKYDPIVPGDLDRGGAINTITPRNCTSKNTVGMAVSGFLVEVEKTDLDDLRARHPAAFARAFHPTAGPCMDGVLQTDTEGPVI